ncbi:unnamed protein product [Cylindrotheca closterium]|uniref:Uncharacterized protein n=1 Tax=Cylindrotheca closterium TaxID=2856 RepID=A0AAD2G0J7_9STRA|nr:unnamed protein product [Cylindrotheca closterium]
MPLRIDKKGTEESSQNEKAKSRLVLRVCLVILFLAILHIGSEQTGLKGFRGNALFPASTSSALVWKSSSSSSSSSSQQKEVILDLVDDEQEYIKWLVEEREKVSNVTEIKTPIKVLYRAMAGLGHQLLRLSSAYHLLTIYQIPLIWPTANPVCGGTIFTIYEHLIGKGPLFVDLPYLKEKNSYHMEIIALPLRFPKLEFVNETELSEEERQELVRGINLNNEIPGYSHAVGDVWDMDLPRFQEMDFYNKFQTDYQMYHQLMLLFEHKHRTKINEIHEKTRFSSHTVFALHIRTGNGETGDFEKKSRGIKNLEQWTETVIELLCDYRERNSPLFDKKPLMIFVGTDTGSIVPKLQNISSTLCQIPIVSADQAYPEEGKSVSFLQKYDNDEKCLQGWENMFMDMYFFTKANTVVTGSYSSFTQAAPMSFVMHRAKKNGMLNDNSHPHLFCELNRYGNRMDCFQDFENWLRRNAVKYFGNMSSPEQRIRQELPFPNWRIKSISINKLFAKTLLREPADSKKPSSSSTNRMTFQEWMALNEIATTNNTKNNMKKKKNA